MGEKRIVGLDFGDKTVGVAISDPLFLTAQGLETIHRKRPTKLRQTLARIDEIVREYEADTIVLGYPKNMDDTEGERCRLTKDFKEKIEGRMDVDVILWDERLSTKAAERALIEGGHRREERGALVDTVAAALILQSYLDYQKTDRNGDGEQ